MGERIIPNDTAWLMTFIAIGFDVTNIAVDLLTFGTGGMIVDSFAGATFTIWFSHLGASLWSSSSVGGTLLAIGVSAFPGLDLSFPWTIRVSKRAFNARHPAEVAQAEKKKAINRLYRL